MRIEILAASLVLIACTARPVALDDEAGVTTAMGDSSESGTTTESSGSDSESSDSEGVSIGFVPDEPPIPSSCDTFAQDCPVGEKCVPYAASGGTWDDHKCVPVLGDQQPGEPCSWSGVTVSTDDCDATSYCWDVMDVDGEWIGECAAFCQGSPDMPECPPGFQCLINGDATVTLCVSVCDPLLQDCGEGLACYWANGDFNCIFTTEDLPPGEPCDFINDCAAGNVCVEAALLPACADASCCTAFCDLELGDAGCVDQPGTTCAAFFEQNMAPPGYEALGFCVLPP